MIRVTKKNLFTIGLFLLLFPNPGQSAPILDFNTDGLLTGVRNIERVGGKYDVRFVDGSCLELLDDCEYNLEPGSQNELDFQVDDLFRSTREFTSLHEILVDAGLVNSPLLINGCESSERCFVTTPSSWFRRFNPRL